VRAILPLIAALALGVLGSSTCGGTATQTAESGAPAPTSPAATALPSPTPAPAAVLTPGAESTDSGAAWPKAGTEELAIRLPAGWRVVRSGDTTEALPAFKQDNQELAGFLDGGSRIETVFAARDGAGGAQRVADNLNIRRTALDGGGAERVPEIAEAVAAQYRSLGFDVREIVPGIEIGGLPAARIVTAFPASGRDGERVDLVGLQLLAAAPDALWILTYTTASERFEAMRGVFEESAESFEVR
jgi:hypothetical protein